MPSSIRARVHVSSSIASSASARVRVPSSQRQALYFIRGPRTSSKNSGGSS
jgi:hypothetical protein